MNCPDLFMKKNRLAQLEAHLERIIEGSLDRLFKQKSTGPALAGQLATCMEREIRFDDHGFPHAPDRYSITMHPETLKTFSKTIPDLGFQIKQALVSAARNQDLLIVNKPSIILAEDLSLGPWELEVTAWHSTAPLENTQGMTPAPQHDDPFPAGAYLIINGENHFPLNKAVVNIGRRQENDLTLKDPYVSRDHAQVRAGKGSFVLFDLGSKAGTQVNGITITEHILKPGDVIAIGDSALVYGEEPQDRSDETLGFTPIPPGPGRMDQGKDSS
jgi:hypothetical protein